MSGDPYDEINYKFEDYGKQDKEKPSGKWLWIVIGIVVVLYLLVKSFFAYHIK